MSLAPGTRLGPYEVLSALGAGGMGEVYKARDTRLARTVAIKVLPADTAADVSARARFEREARAIAALSHPHICVVYDVGHQDGIDYLVMELLEGETLADRLAKAKGPLPLEQVLAIGVAIADALDKAHRAGIVHRDLKPANVMLTKSGPKLLDFGLAKLQGAASPVSLSNETAATTAGPGTAQGTILGTIHYMAPEQVEGREADTRTDIWALGALLYEMATGQRPFTGESAASIIGAILNHTPPALSTRQPLTPPAFEHLVERCLAKDPDERWQNAGDVKRELVWIAARADRSGVGDHAHAAPAQAPPSSRAATRLAWTLVVVAAACAAGLAVPAFRYLRQAPPPLPLETRTEILTPPTDDLKSFALSPDGRQIAFVASSGGPARLWLRSLATAALQPLPGTDGASSPFWSPDSRSVGFFANGTLRLLDLGGGVPHVVATAGEPRGGTWNADGTILFTASTGSGLVRVAASGGAVTAVTVLNRQSSHRYPYFLPDGRHFLFLAQGAPDVAGVYLGSLDSSDTHRLMAADSAAAYLASPPAWAIRSGGNSSERSDAAGDQGWVVWQRAAALVAQRLDIAHQALVGDIVTLAEAVAGDSAGGSWSASLSTTGLVAYRAGSSGRRQLLWVDRTGRTLGTVGAPDEDGLRSPRVSPDGRRVAVTRTVQGNSDIWVLDGSRANRLTFDAAQDRYAVWSPDGSRIAFESNRNGQRDVYETPATGGGTEELLVASPQTKQPFSWSGDGRFLLFSSTSTETNADIWVLPVGGDRTPFVFLKTTFRETYERFSPDGRWVAYQSDESGRPEIQVRAFTGQASPPTTAAGRWQVSTAGGVSPVWRPDGKELFYLSPTGAMMAAAITANGSTLTVGAPATLFPTRIYGGGGPAGQGPQFDVAPDGRFLVDTELDDAPAPITVLQNWRPDAK